MRGAQEARREAPPRRAAAAAAGGGAGGAGGVAEGRTGVEETVASAAALAFAAIFASFTFRILWVTFLIAVQAFKYVVVAAMLVFGVLLCIP